MGSTTTKPGTAPCLILPPSRSGHTRALARFGAPLRRRGPPDPRPAEKLMQLVPPDMAVVVTIEDLREHASAFLKSRLAEDLSALPAVRAWFASEKYQHLERRTLSD